MSAFILSDKHLSTIARLIMPENDVQAFANMLKSINIASVNYRYNEKTRKSKCKLVTLDDCINVTMNDLCRLIQCWSYQSCEGDLLEYRITYEFIYNKMRKLGYSLEDTFDSKLWSI